MSPVSCIWQVACILKRRQTCRLRFRVAGEERSPAFPVAYLAVWAAVYAVASILPAISPGRRGHFWRSGVYLDLGRDFCFGPIAGAIAATIGGLLASFIGPATAYFGFATFYPHTIGAPGGRTADGEYAKFTHRDARYLSDRPDCLASAAHVLGNRVLCLRGIRLLAYVSHGSGGTLVLALGSQQDSRVATSSYFNRGGRDFMDSLHDQPRLPEPRLVISCFQKAPISGCLHSGRVSCPPSVFC